MMSLWLIHKEVHPHFNLTKMWNLLGAPKYLDIFLKLCFKQLKNFNVYISDVEHNLQFETRDSS